jgi:Serine dehydrogenase proteinase
LIIVVGGRRVAEQCVHYQKSTDGPRLVRIDVTWRKLLRANAWRRSLADEQKTKQLLKDAANKFAQDTDSDIFILNYEIMTPIDYFVIDLVEKRKRRENIVVLITTEGGSADAAFKIMRCLQANYKKVSVVVAGWCKSAGTLMCIGAHELFFAEGGELGPLDVQIVKADEMDEQKSGLVAEAAFEKLQQEAYKFFMSFVRDIGGSEYRVTLKTAADIAVKMTVGMIQPIFDKLDPVTIGEDYRSNKLAQAYAERLNIHGRNLHRTRQFDALHNLLTSYPSHGFVIDVEEAKTLFRKVNKVADGLAEVVNLLGVDAVLPRNRRQEQSPRLEYLNDDKLSTTQGQVASTESERTEPNKLRSTRGRKGTRNISGNPKERSAAKPERVSNGTNPEK